MKSSKLIINWWYVGLGIFGLAALGGGIVYAVSRNFIGVLLLLVFAGLAYGCFYKGSRLIAQVPTLTAEAPTTGKVNCLCIYGARDVYNINKAVRIQFEHREDKETIEAKIATLKAEITSPTSEVNPLIKTLENELTKAPTSSALNSDRWHFDDINKWLPVIYTNLDNEGAWEPFELPDAKYTDPARMAIPLNMSAVQKWRELEASMFEKLKPLIMIGANLMVLFFMFLLASDKGGR